MRKQYQWLCGAGVAVALLLILAGISMQVRNTPADQDDEEEQQAAIKTPSRVSVQNGETVVTLDADTQSRAGITVTALQPGSARQQVSAPAMVISAQELVGLRNNFVAAQVQLEKARANLEVARKEYERLKTLYEDNQNASQKSLESSEVTQRSAQADVQAAEQELELAGTSVQQNWGEAVARWVRDGSPELNRVLAQTEMLVQVTLPPDNAGTPPQSISLEIPGAIQLRATFVSGFPRVDPRIQGFSFLYVAPSHPGLAPGAALIARLTLGKSISGIVVPEQGVVWWEGKAWAYQQTAANRFVRRVVSTDTRLPNGFLAANGFSPREKIVLSGAQSLLTEEFRSLIQPED